MSSGFMFPSFYRSARGWALNVKSYSSGEFAPNKTCVYGNHFHVPWFIYEYKNKLYQQWISYISNNFSLWHFVLQWITDDVSVKWFKKRYSTLYTLASRNSLCFALLFLSLLLGLLYAFNMPILIILNLFIDRLCLLWI